MGTLISARTIGFVFMFQTPRLLAWRTVTENVALVLDDDDPRHERIPEMLAAVGLADAGSAYPERLSLGMQRRAALARAFISEPDILLMDEPFVSLDDPTAQSLRQLLIELWSRRPTTVLFVTHDRTESIMLATRLLRFSGAPATIVQIAPSTCLLTSVSTAMRSLPSRLACLKMPSWHVYRTQTRISAFSGQCH